MTEELVITTADVGKVFAGPIRSSEIEAVYSKIDSLETTAGGIPFSMGQVYVRLRSGREYGLGSVILNNGNFRLDEAKDKIREKLLTEPFLYGTLVDDIKLS